MLEVYGQCQGSLVLLHGGAGGQDPKALDSVSRATAALKVIAAAACKDLDAGMDPMQVLTDVLAKLEDDPQFNAGTGSALQSDGQVRLTAALMDGERQSFSGVISCSFVKNPIILARHLQNRSSRVLTNPGSELLARDLGLPVTSNLTKDRIDDWAKKVPGTSCDTVGCVIRTNNGRILVGTSTGGRGFEFPGRVSDSGTVAGTYASKFAGISATGVGEEIVDDGLAVRLETRCRDGMTLEKAGRLAFNEAIARKRLYGWIAVDSEGFWNAAYTTAAMSYVVFDRSGLVQSSFTSG
jgi:L-asparaginase